jgi:prepilin-type N-terminal cleavage/methylation domain-containing protein
MLRKLNNQRGDTIVEVLISIAVISLVLTAGNATTMRSVNGMQVTQEQ